MQSSMDLYDGNVAIQFTFWEILNGLWLFMCLIALLLLLVNVTPISKYKSISLWTNALTFMISTSILYVLVVLNRVLKENRLVQKL